MTRQQLQMIEELAQSGERHLSNIARIGRFLNYLHLLSAVYGQLTSDGLRLGDVMVARCMVMWAVSRLTDASLKDALVWTNQNPRK